MDIAKRPPIYVVKLILGFHGLEFNAGVSMIIIDQMHDLLPISSIPLRHSNIPGGAADSFF